MVNFSRSVETRDLADGVKKRGELRVRRTKRDVSEILQAANILFWILYRQHVIVSGLGVNPVTGSDHSVGGECGDDVVHYFPLIQPKFARAQPIHIELEGRIIKILRN